MISLPGRRVEVAGRLVGEDHARLDGERAGDRDALLLAARELRRQVVGALGEADLARAAPRARWRSPTSETPVGASFASTFSSAVSVGIRLNCWKTKPNERSRSSASSPSRQLGEVAALEEDASAARAGRARRGAGAASSCRSRSGPRARRTRPARSSGRRPASALIDERPADEGLRRRRSSSYWLIRPSSARRRGAGARRASAPAAPASRPPRTASAKPASRIDDADGRRERDGVVTCVRVGLLEAEEAAAAGRRAGAQRRSERADRERRPRRRGRRRGRRRARPGERLAGDLAHDLAAASSRAPSACPSSRTRLPTEESVSSAASRNAATAATIESARPRLCERLAASTSEPLIVPATCFALATSRLVVGVLDPLLDGGDGGAVVGADEHDVDEILLARELLELRERQVDVDALAAERRLARVRRP